MLILSQSWSIGSSLNWSLCPLDMALLVFERFLSFWHKTSQTHSLTQILNQLFLPWIHWYPFRGNSIKILNIGNRMVSWGGDITLFLEISVDRARKYMFEKHELIYFLFEFNSQGLKKKNNFYFRPMSHFSYTGNLIPDINIVTSSFISQYTSMVSNNCTTIMINRTTTGEI